MYVCLYFVGSENEELTNSPNSPGTNKNDLIIGLVVGLGVPLIILALCCLYRAKKKDEGKKLFAFYDMHKKI